MTLLIDLNVILDVLQKRDPHYRSSALLVTEIVTGTHTGALPSYFLPTLFYITRKAVGRERALSAIDWTLSSFEICNLAKSDLVRARELEFEDYEDGLAASVAIASSCDYIITRNTRHFERSPIPALTPIEFLFLTAR